MTGDEVSVEFVGTATTVLRLGPFTVLTDPNFLRRGQRAYLGKGLSSRRRTDPALGLDQLPELDLLVLSHLHGDHFDRVARRGLDRTVPVLTTPPAARRLSRWGFDPQGLEAWQHDELTSGDWDLRVTATPGTHAPGPARRLLPEVMGSVMELRHAGVLRHRLFVSGDTLYRPWLGDVVNRTGPLDSMVIHLGGTRILGMLVTMDASQGADLVTLLRPAITVPVHFDDYAVFRSPLGDFVRTWRERSLPGTLRLVERGQRVDLE